MYFGANCLVFGTCSRRAD